MLFLRIWGKMFKSLHTAPSSTFIKWFPVHKASIRIETDPSIKIGAGIPWYLIDGGSRADNDINGNKHGGDASDAAASLLHLGTHAEPRTLGDIN